MAGLLSRVAGGLVLGAAKGYGEGMAVTGQQKREMMLKELGYQHDREMQANRQTFQVGENDRRMQFDAEQNQLNRQDRAGLLSNSERFVDSKGRQWLRKADGSVVPINGPDGEQLMGKPDVLTSSEPLNEVFDPNSPTGTKYVPRSQAVGKPGKTGAKAAADQWAFDQETAADEARTAAQKAADDRDPTGPDVLRPEAMKKAYGSLGEQGWTDSVERSLKQGNSLADAIAEADRKAGIAGSEESPNSGGAMAAEPSHGSKPAGKSADSRGSGTRQDPFRPTTEAEFDVIKPGEYYVDPGDGKLYRRNSTPYEAAKSKKPAGYPDAKWSDKVGAWVVQRGDQWYRVTE